jgi:glycosyltransferase involved in cell wall biosynthesis
MGAFRIYESEAWRHYHLGRYETMRDPHNGQPMYGNEIGIARNYSFVIQNARDADEWPVGEGRGDYVLYMGRIIDVKGCLRIAEMIRRWDKLHPDDGLRFVFAGQGDFDRVASATIKGNANMVKRLGYEGHVIGKARASLVGNAIAMLCPTQYVEPGGGSAIEAQLCGTPVLASAWGCFTESVLHGVTGYQCRTWGDWMAALEWAPKLSRRTIAQVARERFSFEAAAPQYVKVLKTLELLFKNDEVTSLVIP